MKKAYLVLSLLFLMHWSQAQIVNIPDANFKNALVATNCVDIDGDNIPDEDADTNDDGEIQESEALAITSLSMVWEDITDLTGIESFTNITYLNVSVNKLTSLDLSENLLLQELRCSSNLLTSLSLPLHTALQKLYCRGNELTSLDISNNTMLSYLECKDNMLTTLDISQNTLLQTLDVENNMLTTLNTSQNFALFDLKCSYNNITTLDFSQNIALGGVQCSNNMLTALDFSQNPQFTGVNCKNNMITQLDLSSNTNLTYFVCSDNPLTSIDISNSPQLTNFQCDNTLLTELDFSNSKVVYFSCKNNPNLVFVNAKNGYVSYTDIDQIDITFNLSGNPQLEYICADEGLETRSFNRLTGARVNSFCTFTPGGNYIEIEGTTFFDPASDGCDINDSVFPNMSFIVDNGYIDTTITGNTSGNHELYVRGGTYTITPQLENPSYFTVSPTSITINAATASNPTVQDFCVTPNGTHDDVEVTIIPIEDARPGFDTTYQILYKNKGTTTLSGNVQLTFDDDLMDLVVANPIADTQALHSLTWNYTNLTPFETRTISLTMNINTPTDVPAVNGDDVLTYEVMVTPAADDETPDNNIMTLEQTVVNSFDPNDIRCLEGETVTTDYIGKYVHYLIRFENTGTASAVNVVVTDEIDTAKFDITTLRPVASSHAMVTNIKNENEVEFIFENINLPFDDASNDGYLVFKVKTLASLVENDTFENSANIYFDFNAPIITNTASTLIQDPLSVAEENLETAIKLYPNPAKELVQITSQTPIEKLELRTIQGKLIKSKNRQTTNFSSTVNISSLPTGIYLIKITTTKGTAIKKIVKQ